MIDHHRAVPEDAEEMYARFPTIAGAENNGEDRGDDDLKLPLGEVKMPHSRVAKRLTPESSCAGGRKGFKEKYGSITPERASARQGDRLIGKACFTPATSSSWQLHRVRARQRQSSPGARQRRRVAGELTRSA